MSGAAGAAWLARTRSAMQANFTLFGATHLAILAAIPASAGLAAAAIRRWPHRARPVRRAAGLALAVNELIWWAYRYGTEGLRVPEGLPLQLCDVAVWMTVAAMLGARPWAFEAAYFIGLAGSGMGALTPDLWTPWPSYPAIYFFLAHGLVVGCVLTLVWSGQARPGPGSLWRVFAGVNVYGAAITLFNAAFGTNYLYLCRKPQGATILDWFGPWPYYIAGGEAAALALFTLLWLPWRGGRVRSMTSGSG